MTIGADVAASKPTVIGAIRSGTELRVRVDGASASSGASEYGWWRAWRLTARIGTLLTGLTERFVDQSGKGFGRFGALASAFVQLGRRRRCGASIVEPPDMDEETEENQRDQEELVK
jgi:hypothetical protein